MGVVDGGMNQEPICIPSQLKDLAIILLYPPLFVLLRELKNHTFSITNVIISFILTCCFYFPGVLHALSILRFNDINPEWEKYGCKDGDNREHCK